MRPGALSLYTGRVTSFARRALAALLALSLSAGDAAAIRLGLGRGRGLGSGRRAAGAASLPQAAPALPPPTTIAPERAPTEAGEAGSAQGAPRTALEGLSLPLPQGGEDRGADAQASGADRDFRARVGERTPDAREGGDVVLADGNGAAGVFLAPAGRGGGVSRKTPPTPEEARAGRASAYARLSKLLRPLVRLFYRIEVKGDLPPGPALIMANHVSWVDAVLLSYAADRPMRFLMSSDLYESMKGVVEPLGAIPIRFSDDKKRIMKSLLEARKALQDGETVVIFPEGNFTYNGFPREMKGGFLFIHKDSRAPLVPSYIDGQWGSALSMRDRVKAFSPAWFAALPGRFLRGEIPRKVTVYFGAPAQARTVEAAQIALQELGAKAMDERVRSRRGTLAREFLARAMEKPGAPALFDSTGADMTYRKALAATILLGGALDRALAGEERVGVALPTTSAGALANLALTSIGKAPVNLAYTEGAEVLARQIETAGLKTVVTSRKFLEKLGKDESSFPGARLVFVEDLKGRIGLLRKAWTALTLLLPRAAVERLHFSKASRDLDDEAAVLFTGSFAKAVPLTHANLLSDVEMIREVTEPTKDEVTLGVLPFFYAFGFTVTLWMPLLAGAAAAFHANPKKSLEVAALAERTGATRLVAPPELLERLIGVPPAAMRTVRHVLTGGVASPALVDAYERWFGTRPLSGSGSTETSPVASLSVGDVYRDPLGRSVKPELDPGSRGSMPGSVGRALPGSAARVVDEEGNLLPFGTVGRLQIKGPHVAAGYLGDPERTAKAFQDGWYDTGDRASIDAQGFIFPEEAPAPPAVPGDYLKRTEDGRSIGVRRIESLFGRAVEVLDVSDHVSERPSYHKPDVMVTQAEAAFAERKAFLGFGQPNVYLSLPSAEGWDMFHAYFTWRKDSELVPSAEGKMQSAAMIVFKDLTDAELRRLHEAAERHVGGRHITCVNANARVLEDAGFLVGGRKPSRYWWPTSLLRDILQKGLTLDGRPVAVDLVRTTPHFLEDYRGSVERAARGTLQRHLKRALAKGKAAPAKAPRPRVERALVRLPAGTADAPDARLRVSEPTPFGWRLRKLWGTHALFTVEPGRAKVDDYLPERLKEFPQENPSLATRIKMKVLFTPGVIAFLRRHLVGREVGFSGWRLSDVYEMLRVDDSDHRNRYNIVLEGGAVTVMKVASGGERPTLLRRLADWILTKHVLMSGYSADVRFAGEFWKGEDGRIHVSGNSGTYRPTPEQLDKAVEYLRASFPGLDFVAAAPNA